MLKKVILNITNGVFPEWNRNSVNSGNLVNHFQSMNWNQFKDSVSDRCFAGTVVASWFLTREVAGSNPFTVMNSLNSVKTFR